MATYRLEKVVSYTTGCFSLEGSGRDKGGGLSQPRISEPIEMGGLSLNPRNGKKKKPKNSLHSKEKGPFGLEWNQYDLSDTLLNHTKIEKKIVF